MNYCVNIDWLAVHCYCSSSFNPEGVEGSSVFANEFIFKKQEYSGRVYKYKFCVYDCAENYCYDIYTTPFSAILPAWSCQVRLSNEECYKRNKIERLFHFMGVMDFSYKNITRIDICFDSNMLHGGLKHQNLIKKFFSGEYLLNRKAKYNIFGVHRNTNQVTGIKIDNVRQKMMKGCADGSDSFEHTGVRFGSVKSAVSVKMYNKTLEMKEVKRKDYIVDCWSDNKLDIKKDVWRIEFSISADATNMVRLDSGELFRLCLDDVMLDKQNQELFFNLAYKYFRFKRNDGTKNKSRMDDVQLFDIEIVPTFLRTRVDALHKSNRMDKYVVKRLVQEQGDNKSYTIYEQNLMTYLIYEFARKYRVNEKFNELETKTEVGIADKQKLLYRMQAEIQNLKEEIRKELKTI